MHALALILLLLQAPGDGWALAQVPPRQVKTLYWELFNTSEIWVSLIPADQGGGPPLVRLIFQALFVGKETKGVPSRLVVRVLGLPLTVVREYTLRLVLNNESLDVDLGSSCISPGASGPRCQLLYPVCEEGCSANGVEIEVQPSLLKRLADAHAVTGTALGFPIMLTADDRAAVGRFADAIQVKVAPRK